MQATRTSSYGRAIFYAFGIYVCFLSWGLLQERITTSDYGGNSRFRHFVFMNVCQSLVASAWAYALAMVLRNPITRLPTSLEARGYFKCALSNSIASPFGYHALKHVNFPTVILAKSCKLVPVMAVGALVFRQRFPLYKYASVALITTGIFIFMFLAESNSSKAAGSSNSFLGIALVGINLFLDGFTNTAQEHLFKRFKMSSHAMMCFTNMFMTLLMSLWLVNPWNDEFSAALRFCMAHPTIVYDILLFCFCGAAGQTFVYFLLESSGSIALVTVTVTRKLFSILLSVAFFGHQVSAGQLLGISLVFAGIVYEEKMKRVPRSMIKDD